jgi:hypothetical protein
VIAVLKNAYNPAGASLGARTDAGNRLQSMPSVDSRIARASYGCIFDPDVRYAFPPVDPEKETPYVDLEGVKRISRVKWFLMKVRICRLFFLISVPVSNTYTLIRENPFMIKTRSLTASSTWFTVRMTRQSP